MLHMLTVDIQMYQYLNPIDTVRFIGTKLNLYITILLHANNNYIYIPGSYINIYEIFRIFGHCSTFKLWTPRAKKL